MCLYFIRVFKNQNISIAIIFTIVSGLQVQKEKEYQVVTNIVVYYGHGLRRMLDFK